MKAEWRRDRETGEEKQGREGGEGQLPPPTAPAQPPPPAWEAGLSAALQEVSVSLAEGTGDKGSQPFGAEGWDIFASVPP